jgi:hypothetical protein
MVTAPSICNVRWCWCTLHLGHHKHWNRSLMLLPALPLQDDERMLQDIQRFYNTVIEELPSNVADLI